ncbi:hypothetical protein EFL02_08550 [Enterococcus faecium]|nr:hypothetical protein [Enterococcus faecium]EGP5249107.1 hypothetical protein [Enterococcus faecium]EGP5393441.1 hypothetical protein [Enterococcus faecium]
MISSNSRLSFLLIAPPPPLNKKAFSLLYIIRVFICTAVQRETNHLFFIKKTENLNKQDSRFHHFFFYRLSTNRLLTRMF